MVKMVGTVLRATTLMLLAQGHMVSNQLKVIVYFVSSVPKALVQTNNLWDTSIKFIQT